MGVGWGRAFAIHCSWSLSWLEVVPEMREMNVLLRTHDRCHFANSQMFLALYKACYSEQIYYLRNRIFSRAENSVVNSDVEITSDVLALPPRRVREVPAGTHCVPAIPLLRMEYKQGFTNCRSLVAYNLWPSVTSNLHVV